MKVIKYILFFIVLFAFVSCYNTRSIGYLQDRGGLPHYKQGVADQYKLQKNDEILIRMITSDQKSAAIFQNGTGGGNQIETYHIYDDGTVDLPFVSRIPVAGLTMDEAEKIIEKRFKPYIPDVKIKVALQTGTFCVVGDAGKGFFPMYKDHLNIFEALAVSGGIAQNADYGHVKILRVMPDGKTKIISFDIRSKSIIDSKYYYVYPNDIIYLDTSKKAFWAASSYMGFLGLITSSVTFLLTVVNLLNQ